MIQESMHEQTIQFFGYVFDDYSYNMIHPDILEKVEDWPALYGVHYIHDATSGDKAFGICDTGSFVVSESIQGFHRMPVQAKILEMKYSKSYNFLTNILGFESSFITKLLGLYTVEGRAL